jgi:tRNA-dihydrouridine synthase
MKESIWKRLKKPFFVLAPMENVTDTVFRRVVAGHGRPDLFFTEFTNTEGLCSKGFERVRKNLEFTEMERPIIAQIWGNKPEFYLKTSHLLVEMGFDGIDINMGCPERKIVKNGSCGGLIRNPGLAKEIIQATKEGAGDLPVSVKTRIGLGKIETEEWLGFLLEQNIAALTVHGRTVAEMSKVPCHWDEIGKAVGLRDKMKKDTLIVGNGDVLSRREGLEKCAEYGVDGIMIGRGIFKNLWVFREDSPALSYGERLQLLIDHIVLFNSTWGEDKNFEIMKKFYKVYLSGSFEENELRMELMAFRTAEDTIKRIMIDLENCIDAI